MEQGRNHLLCLPTTSKSRPVSSHPEKAMAPHSSTLAWKIPWMEEPGRLQPMGSLRVGHDWATSLSLFTFMHWRRQWQPPPVSCLENPRDGGAWWAAVYGVAQSQTRLKWLSSSSSKLTPETWEFLLMSPHPCSTPRYLPSLHVLGPSVLSTWLL